MLLIGISIALVMRGIFIPLGTAIIENFTWAFYVFGLFLMYTACKLVGSEHDDEDEENAFIRSARGRADHQGIRRRQDGGADRRPPHDTPRWRS